MKREFKFLFITALLVCVGLVQASAQMQMPPTPIDANVRIGKLDNGLTYYIRKNNLPENRADFYIAQKVGSIQETDDQKGLAHFLEHMAFNGTTHFPGDNLKQYLETIGVKFGANLNAYTSVERTVYNISNVPVTREGVVDSCLLILHDWADGLTLNTKEIDKERGVIHEEWRSRMNAVQRLRIQALPQIYEGTKYADCMPIGHMDVILNFKPQTLRDYYEAWYRPDLQGIIVVGDIDVDAVEGKIKQLFSPIAVNKNAPERVYYPVNDNKEPIIVIGQDKEMPNIQVLLFNKHDITPDNKKGNLDYLVVEYLKELMSTMFNARLEEIRQTANPPFTQAGGSDGSFFVSKTKGTFTGYAVCKEEDIVGGFTALLREFERVRRFGFTESEYVRARAEYLRHVESAYNERDKNRNENYAEQYVDNYLDNEPIPGIENYYNLINQIAPNIPVEAVNQLFPTLVTGSNQVVWLLGPEKEGLVYPTKQELADAIKQVAAEELTAYVDKVSDEPLMSELPTPGKIVSEKEDAIFGTTMLTLSNGVKVIVKPTDFKADEINMLGTSLGGTSLFPDSEIINIKTINSVIKAGGFGNFSPTDLEKVLAGKKAWASTSVERLTENVSGSCSPKDFETMLQLTYLSFTAPRKDEEAFASFKNRTKTNLQNYELHPSITFQDSVNSVLYQNHPRSLRIKPDMIDQIDYDKILNMYNDRFKDASDFTFIFVGNIDLEEAKPLFEQYLGSLPAINRKESFAKNDIPIRKGKYKNEFIRTQETAKATNLIFYHGNCKYNPKNQVMMDMMQQILTLVYTEKVREDEGGTYYVSVHGELSKYPKEEYTMQIYFDTAPSKKDKLIEIIFAEINAFATQGPSEQDLSKVKEYMLKKYAENLKENGYWLDIINEYIFTNTDKNDGYEQLVNSINTTDLRKFAHELLIKQGNEIEINMISPEKE